jgi:hypothetical protein
MGQRDTLSSGQTRMEGIGHGGVVDEDTLRDVSVEERQVFHIMASVIHTALTKETVVDHLARVREERGGRADIVDI